MYIKICVPIANEKKSVTPQGVNGALNLPKLYASGLIDISKCIEGGSSHECISV